MVDSPTGGIAAEVRAIMARNRISQQEAADAAGISQSSMSRRLAGVAPFTVNEIYRIASLCGVDPTDLLPTKASA
ncbi:helix-turn-helix domain-containing protein [Mycobacterium sp. NBC_00419]|uniref:helix-turn-helix domain-containing protein n=1 Tax=Mycobacterium sp. NBC_00419 TaxID=2975989 RepID=UPI002E1E7B1C